MTAAELLARLDKVTGGNEQWTACCPAHEDRNPSLSVTETPDRLLLHCHAGCSIEAITSALGCAPKDLFADTNSNGRLHSNIIAEYNYCDEHGELLYQVVRFAPKDFRQRRPDGNGGWLWNLNGVRRVLYRLPEVLGAVAAGRLVYLVEGERDVDSVDGAGEVATTNPMGAGKWRDEYAETFRGATVRIVADRDEPGRAHAHQVAASLRGVAQSVDVLQPTTGKDVSDHLQAGRTLADLVPLAEDNASPGGRDPLDTCGLKALSVGCALEDITECLRKLKGLTNGDDTLARRTLRNRAIQTIKAINVPDAAGMVDAAGIAGGGSATGESGPGHAIAFADPEPWPQPADGDVLLADLRRFLARFVVMPSGGHEVLAAFTLVTYAADVFAAVPYVALESPTPECGKTRTLEMLSLLARRPWFTLMPSTAVLFRVLEQYHPTMLLDECQAVHGRGEAAENVRDLLLAGYKRGGTVPRCVGDNHEVRFFDVTGPKVFALIGQLPGALASRCIRIPMQHRTVDELVERFRVTHVADEAAAFTRRAQRWADDHREALAAVDPAMPSFLSDRLEEIWEPLFRVAAVAGGDWRERLAAAATLLGGTRSDDDIRTMLLADVREVWPPTEARIPSAELAERLVALEGRPWAERRGRDLSANGLARLVRPLGIRPKKLRFGDDSRNGYERESFADAWGRYLPPAATGTLEHPSNDAGFGDFLTGTSDEPCSGCKTAETPGATRNVPVFRLPEGGTGEMDVKRAWDLAEDVENIAKVEPDVTAEAVAERLGVSLAELQTAVGLSTRKSVEDLLSEYRAA